MRACVYVRECACVSVCTSVYVRALVCLYVCVYVAVRGSGVMSWSCLLTHVLSKSSG